MAIDIMVWGDYACFTRPEFKVERVSYPVMTPSAARGILEAIYWKPQIRFRIKRIGILKLGNQWSLLRNEISSRQSKKGQPIVVDDNRQQRTSLVLKDVCYRIQSWIEPRNGETNIAKHLDCFRRRTEKGQYFHKPYLGCREFVADFEWLGCATNNKFQPDGTLNMSIGTMLYDTAYIVDPKHYEEHPEDQLEFIRHTGQDVADVMKGYAKRFFFNAEVSNGWLVGKGERQLPDKIFYEITKIEEKHGAT